MSTAPGEFTASDQVEFGRLVAVRTADRMRPAGTGSRAYGRKLGLGLAIGLAVAVVVAAVIILVALLRGNHRADGPASTTNPAPVVAVR